MAFKKIKKYDLNNNLVKVFNSMQECIKEDNISDYLIRKSSKNDKIYNGFKYKIQENKPYYTIATCDWCGKEFKCERFRTEDGRQHLFCNHKCEGEFYKSKTELNCICEVCGKPYHMKQSHINKYGSKYCSIECHAIAKKEYMKGDKNHQYGLKGDKNASWKSDERISYYGYRLIRCLNHPFANCDGFVFEHRLIAEKYLLNDNNSIIIDSKKYLNPEFVVHHIDFNKLNNTKENLCVMLLGEHRSLHHKLRNNRNELLNYCKKYSLDIDIIEERMNLNKN